MIPETPFGGQGHLTGNRAVLIQDTGNSLIIKEKIIGFPAIGIDR